jgi:hypothetical protein
MSERYISRAWQPVDPARAMQAGPARAIPAGPARAIPLLVLALSVCMLTRAPANALAAGGAFKGTAEGILVADSELASEEITSSSASNYQVELSFSFSVGSGGDVSGTGNGYYTDAHWHLAGVNGKEGPFDCDPPVTAGPFKVELSGHRSGHDVLLDLAIPEATETNENYECGSNYSGFATTSHYMAESLELVGGKELHVSTAAPTSLTLEKTVETGDSEDHHTYLHIWSFSVTPPRSGGSSGSDTGAGGSCSLSLTRVAAKPSPGHAGKPITVSFHVSAPANAALLVAPVGAAASTVASLTVPKGLNQLVWGGWLGTQQAAPGQYALTVEAKACGRTRTQTVTVTTQ